MAKVTQVIDGDTDGLVRALANVEKRLDAVDNKLQRTKATAEKPVRPGLDSVDPLASSKARFSKGVENLKVINQNNERDEWRRGEAEKVASAKRVASATEKINIANQQQERAEWLKAEKFKAAKAEHSARLIERSKLQDVGYGTFNSSWKGTKANQDADAAAAQAVVARWQASNNAQMGAADRAKTQGIISQVRAQQAAQRAAQQSAAELAKQPGLIEGAGSAAMRYLGPLALAATAVKLIGNEWGNVIERQQKAGQVALSFEEALGEATLNVGAIYGPEKLKTRALDISEKSGVAPATAVTALSLAIKSGGATTAAEAERLSQATEVAAKLSPRAGAEKLADTSGSVASYMARTGATAEAAGGVLLSMQSKSNIADANKAMSAMGPTLANMLAQGASQGMAQALAPALSQAVEDTQGDVSSLAATQFTTSLTDAFAGRAKAAGRKDVPDFALEQMRADPELAHGFFTGSMIGDDGKAVGKPELGRGKAATFFRAISGDKTLAGDDKIIQSYVNQFEDFRKSAVTNDEGEKFYKDRLAQVGAATPHLQVERQFKSAADRNRLSGDDAMRGISREGLADLMQSSGASDISKKISTYELDLTSGNSLKETASTLRERAMEKREESFTWMERLGKSYTLPKKGQTYEQLQNEQYRTAKDPESERVAKNLENAAKALDSAAQALKPQVNRNGGVEVPAQPAI